MDLVFWQLCSIGLVLVVGLPLAFISANRSHDVCAGNPTPAHIIGRSRFIVRFYRSHSRNPLDAIPTIAGKGAITSARG